jgi:hypothetical protein
MLCSRNLSEFRCDPDLQSEAEVAGRYFVAFCFVLASARRSVFFRRLARLLALSLPLLLPISPTFARLSRRSNGANGMSDIEGKVAREAMSEYGQRASFNSDETEAGVCAVAAFDAISAAAHPALWSLAHPALAPAS